MKVNKKFAMGYLNKFELVIIISLLILLNGCKSLPGTFGHQVSENTKIIMAHKELANKELLDVSIKIFEPGTLPEKEEERSGLSDKIRFSEARFIPIHLKYTLQRSGYWGNIRVIPEDNEGSEILVKGEIIKSDGESIELKISVFDGSDTKWFEKYYSRTVEFNERKETEIERTDVFQDIYNKISNDIIEYRQKLTQAEIERIKQISEIRFAKYMTPDLYSSYIVKDENHVYQLTKLPSFDDPMIKRIRTIKARDEMLVDTINNHYDLYYNNMWESYDNWRKFRSEELETIRDIENKALTQKIIGIAAIVGAIALGASSNADIADSTAALRTVMIAAGGYAIYSGVQTSKESEMNKEAIEELGESFSTEIEPILIDMDGKTMKLTGSADQQYMKWKKLLQAIYHKESGF